MRPASAGTAVAAVILAACSATGKPPPARLPDTGEPALHAVQNHQLHQLMAQMNSLMFETFRTELEIDKERRRQASQIADTARELSGTIDAIPATLPKLGLNDAEQVSFLALARRLHEQSQGLEQLARANQIDAMGPALQQMTLTCNACHQLFRKLDGSGARL